MDPAQYIDPSLGVPAGAPATSLPGSISTTPQQMVNNSQGKILKIIMSDSEISKQFKLRVGIKLTDILCRK